MGTAFRLSTFLNGILNGNSITVFEPHSCACGHRVQDGRVYDNTVWNPLNPNDPPIEVGYGSLTTDEMFLVYFIWADHQPGTKTWCLTPSRRTWMR